jgi:solute carrier family 25 iron transporter 28/37
MSDDFDPHNTDWHNVDIVRFTLWMSLFSIGENAIFYPFYVLKTREQADRSVNYKALASARYHLTSILKTQGVRRGLYRGFFASSIVSLPAYGLYSGVYTWSKEKLGYQHSGTNSSITQSAYQRAYINYGAPFLAGLIADVASVVLYVPGDVIVQRMQIANSPYSSFTDACIKVWRSEGISGFYRGFSATLWTGAVASACWWMCYENSKRTLYDWLNSNHTQNKSSDQSVTQVNRWPQFFAGFIAGTVTSVVINPLDVVKTRLQTQHTQSTINQSTNQSSSHTHYRNLSSGLMQVYREEGMRGYFRGVLPKLVSRGPISALSSIMYEMVLYLSRKDRTSSPAVEPKALV